MTSPEKQPKSPQLKRENVKELLEDYHIRLNDVEFDSAEAKELSYLLQTATELMIDNQNRIIALEDDIKSIRENLLGDVLKNKNKTKDPTYS